MLKQGDIVGIYIPSSGAMQSAIDEGRTKNTHVGIVDHIENGIPVIRHNINGQARLDRADRLTGSSYGKPQITVAARARNSSGKKELPELNWNENVKSDMVYQYEHPELVSDKRKSMVNEYMNGLAGSKDNMEMLFPNVDMDMMEKAAIGLLKREGNFMEVADGGLMQNASNYARGMLKNDKNRTVRTSGLKLSSFTEKERKLLDIKSRDDLDSSLQKQARGVMYLLSKNYDYMRRYAERHPELGITEDEMLGFALIGFNQGMGKLYAINPQSIEEFRKTSFNDDYRFPVQYSEKPIGQVLGRLANATQNIPLVGSVNKWINDMAKAEYDSTKQNELHKPYAVDVFDAMKNVGNGQLAQNNLARGGQIFWDNNGQLNPKLKGKPTGIVGTKQGTQITMENVDIDLIGKDNFGNVQYMTEGNNYYFPGQYVVEYPVKPHKAQIGTQFATYKQKPKVSIVPFIDENAYYDDRYKTFNVDDYVDQDGNKHGYPVNFGSHSDEANNMIYETSLRRRINPLSESMVKIDTLDPTSDAYNIEYGIYRGGDNNVYYTLNPEAQDYFDHTKEMAPVKKAELMKILPKRDYIGGKNYRWKAFNMINGLTDTVQNLSQMYGVDPNVMAHRLMKEGFIDDFTNRYNNMSPVEQKRYRDEIWKYGQDGFENFGTDHISSLVDEGKVKFKRNVGYHPYTAINEKGEIANTAMFDNLSGALEANAATLGYITNEMKKKGYSGNNLKSAVNAAYNMGLYNDYLTNAINSGRYNVPTYFQFGGLLDESKFDNYALQAGLQGMRAGLPIMPFVQKDLAPYITSDANYGYVPYSQNYEVQEKPKQKSTAAGKQQKRTKADKMAFVRESFDNWYDTFIRHGHTHEDAIRMSRFFALQDSFESGYGNESSRRNNNFGGMNNVKEAKKQGVHYVPLKYKTPYDYYEAKYSMLWKWPQVFDKNTVKIGQFETAVNSGKQQYAPKSHNPQYRSRLLGMTDAINEIDNYSMNYKPVVRQYGGVIRPFSYQPVPVVRYGNGGMQEYLW